MDLAVQDVDPVGQVDQDVGPVDQVDQVDQDVDPVVLAINLAKRN